MLRYGFVPFVLLAAAMPVSGAPIQITIIPSIAPNSFGGAGWPGYAANALAALETSQVTAGDPWSPSYYSAQTTPVSPGDLIVTGFPSWLGQPAPAEAFGPAFANEYGNRVHFGLVINGNGTKFSLSELTFTEASNDRANLLGFTFPQGSYTYSNTYVGIIDTVDGPTYVTSGPSTQLVDRVVGRGSGAGLPVYCAGCTVEQQRSAILEVLPAFDGMTRFSGTYSLMDPDQGMLASASAWVDVAPVPEPGGMVQVVGGLALIAIGVARKRV